MSRLGKSSGLFLFRLINSTLVFLSWMQPHSHTLRIRPHLLHAQKPNHLPPDAFLSIYSWWPRKQKHTISGDWVFLPCLSFSFSLSLSFLGLVYAGSVWQCQKLNAQSKASPITPGAHRDLPYLAHLCFSGFGMAPDCLGSVDYDRGARVPIPGTTSQAGCPSLKWISPTLLCIPWGRHMAFCRVGGQRTCGWGNSCDKYNQLYIYFTFLPLLWRYRGDEIH